MGNGTGPDDSNANTHRLFAPLRVGYPVSRAVNGTQAPFLADGQNRLGWPWPWLRRPLRSGVRPVCFYDIRSTGRLPAVLAGIFSVRSASVSVSFCFRFNSSTGLGTVGLLHPPADQLPFPLLLPALAYFEGRLSIRRNLC
ncbi:hypothetical protein HMPREF9413_0755 [Paenibacillus sp. HGF7]|nr:hypothetical protein HMPREF9413_0755 [Paenibacillus sp. HGF7]